MTNSQSKAEDPTRPVWRGQHKYSPAIPLDPEKTSEDLDEMELKVKVRRDPTLGLTPSNTLEQTYKTFAGGTAEQYCRFRSALQDYTKRALLHNPQAKFAAVGSLLTGDAKQHWDDLAQHYAQDDAGYEEALNEQAQIYLSADARSEQKRYMRRALKKPYHMKVEDFATRLRLMNRYISFMPGNDDPMPESELVEILVYAMPDVIQNTMVKSDYQWKTKTLPELKQYLGRVSLLSDAVDHKRKAQNQRGKQGDQKRAGRANNGGKYCTYCKKNNHNIDDCRFKKRDEAKKKSVSFQKKKEEEHHEMNAEESDDEQAELDAVADEIAMLEKKLAGEYGEFAAYASANASDDEVSDVDVETLFLQAVTRKPLLTDHTSIADLVIEVVVSLISESSSEYNVTTKRVLVDTGCSKTIVHKRVLNDLDLKAKRVKKERIWKTNGGNFITRYEVPVTFKLPEFAPSKAITWTMAVDESPLDRKYDMIIGRDLQQALGLDILWSSGQLRWEDHIIPMRSVATSSRIEQEATGVPDAMHAYYQELAQMSDEGELVNDASARASRILDAHYEKADISATVDDITHLTNAEKSQLKSLLFKYESLFDGTLGNWNTPPVDFELKDGAKPFHARAYPIPQVHEATLRKDVERLCKLGVLRKCNDSEWAAPSFIIPKKNGTVRFISDFRKLNSLLKRKPFPIPHIQDILRKLSGFTYATSLDINMGYYTIRLTPAASRLCTIVLPWGKYEYLRLPMGVAGSPDIFQEKMSGLMEGLEFIRTYLDDLLIITNGSYEDHLSKVDQVFQRLSEAGLRVNITKCSFASQELEYLGYLLTRDGIKPIAKKVEAILRLKAPKTVKQLRSFLGMVNYYRDMWKRRSHLLAPLTQLLQGVSTKAKSARKAIKWGPAQDRAFQAVKQIISDDVLLAFPDFNATFDIHTDSSDYQLGAVISQHGKPIAFYSRKLTPTQRRYTVGEREMLSIVETLKEFRNILLGHKIVIYTDHENLTRPTTMHESPRVTRWRWLVEEFGPSFEYIKGEHNVVADALSRLDADFTEIHHDSDDIAQAERFDQVVMDDMMHTDNDAYPLSSKTIADYQARDKSMHTAAIRHPQYFSKAVQADGTELMLFHKKIYVPSPLRKRILRWYHTMLCHPGVARTEKTIRQHLTWPGLSADVATYVKSCHECQIAKNRRPKYAHLPVRDIESEPWRTVCVDLVGPYSVTTPGGNTFSLLAMTMCDPCTGWFEIMELNPKTAENAAYVLDRQWFCRYPRPHRCIFDNGREFLGREFQELLESYGVQPIPTTVKNPQANFVERVHDTLGNMLRAHQLDRRELPAQDPFGQILANCAWAIRSTVHTTMDATPAQLVFGRDMIFDIAYKANWRDILSRKRRATNAANAVENKRRVPHAYAVGDKVLLSRSDAIQRKLLPKRDGPFEVIRIYTNGTAKIQRGIVAQVVSLRRLSPYFVQSNSGGA